MMLKLIPMQIADLDEVIAIENEVYSHPWSRGNFVDSLVHHQDAWTVRCDSDVLLGYFVQMPVVDEAHLLNISVKEVMQSQGVGRYLLKHVVERAKFMQMESISLEVRVSNLRVVAIYEAFGFVLVGRRKNYYEMSQKTAQNQREDALILRYVIQPG